MSQDCLFCKIIDNTIPTKKIYEDDLVVAFDDINPNAPVHQLIIPKKHYSTLNDVPEAEKEIVGHMFQVAKKLAEQAGIAEQGYRTVINCNAMGGQTVFHLHLHLLGGKQMSGL
jgi:histidine triad (HIT) family protein